MSKHFSIEYNGVDGGITRRFATLVEVQDYVQRRWKGVEYIDDEDSFHTDFGTHTLEGCTLADLGARDPEDKWSWIWKELTETPTCSVCHENAATVGAFCTACSGGEI